MVQCDALIVGGGPAGSACARALRLAGWRVVVVDRAQFPRDKVCAGWITPDVWRLAELDPAQYRASGATLQEITGFRTGFVEGRSVETRYDAVVSYGIRRREFDDFLLRRAGVEVHCRPVATLRRERDRWVTDDTFAAPVVVGAGGHFCPVARRLRGGTRMRPVVAQEAEFRVEDAAGHTVEGARPQLFFCRDFEGYGWCFRKGDYLNVGIGRRHSEDFASHRRAFVSFIESSGRASGVSRARWAGHAYFAAGLGAWPIVDDGLLLIGDAAGLAYPESGEGIRPAIESGLAAARTLIAADGRYDADRLRPYDVAMRRLHPPVRPRTAPGRLRTALGHALMQSKTFARRAVLDQWFLRR